MKWSILCLTQPSREVLLARMMTVLAPQIANCPDVEFKRRTFDKSLSLGENRQRMIEEADGEYVSQIDDDDVCTNDYVDRIYPLLDGVDQVGFQVQLWIDSQKMPMTYHSIKYWGWSNDEKGFYRDFSHLNPIRRELALQVSFEGGVGEDCRWAKQLREKRIVTTESFIPQVLYYYFYRPHKRD
jgi:hypothetical protein